MKKNIDKTGKLKSYYNSPIGLIEITGTGNSITSLYFVEQNTNPKFEPNSYLENCAAQLDEYFNGKRKDFDLKLEPEGSDFQKKVWDQLKNIQYGETKSYLQISQLLGDVLAIRAVANANGQNKISIVIPCHRVIGSNGSLTGYAGGLWRKKWLLQHEQKYSGSEEQTELFE
jgi:methylated-DNA-[protein]-cysteine S-methyltransferase